MLAIEFGPPDAYRIPRQAPATRPRNEAGGRHVFKPGDLVLTRLGPGVVFDVGPDGVLVEMDRMWLVAFAPADVGPLTQGAPALAPGNPPGRG